MYFIAYDNRNLDLIVVKHTEHSCEYALTWCVEDALDGDGGESDLYIYPVEGDTCFHARFVARADDRGVREHSHEVVKFVMKTMGY